MDTIVPECKKRGEIGARGGYPPFPPVRHPAHIDVINNLFSAVVTTLVVLYIVHFNTTKDNFIYNIIIILKTEDST